MPDLEENHEKWSESGPYGSVRADNLPESIPQGLGSLWDTSRTPKRQKSDKKLRFSGFRRISRYFPLFPYRRCPLQGSTSGALYTGNEGRAESHGAR